MIGVAEVLGGMLVFGGIAAADMSAFQAHAQMDPHVAGLDAVLADVLVRLGESDLIKMRTLTRHC